MGREIKRVPLGFDWPLNKVWEGFINPHYVKCPDCEAGYSEAYSIIHGHISKLMWDRRVTHPTVSKLTTFLAGRAPRGGIFGHDSIDSYAATMTLGRLAKLPKGWELCRTCKGAACHPDHKRAYNAWKPTKPPRGKGWQVWETVSEGSPVSPVFPSSDALADWLMSRGYSTEAAQNFVAGGWAPSMIMSGGMIKQDIESCADMTPRK